METDRDALHGATTTNHMLGDGTLDYSVYQEDDDHDDEDADQTIVTNYGYEFWDSAKLKSLTAYASIAEFSSDQNRTWKPGTSWYDFDVNGNVRLAVDQAGHRAMAYVVSAQGMVLSRDELANGQTLVNKHQRYWF